MTAAAAIEILPARETDPPANAPIMSGIYGHVGQDFCDEKVKAGQWQTVTIARNGAPAFRVYFCFMRDVLYLSAVFAIGCAPMSVLEKGVEYIARQNHCRAIEFCTENKKLIDYAKNWGAKILGVQMIKNL